MTPLLYVGVANALGAALLALVALLVSRSCRRPALAHSLWLLALLKLVTPPLFPLQLAWLPAEAPPAPAAAVALAPVADLPAPRVEPMAAGRGAEYEIAPPETLPPFLLNAIDPDADPAEGPPVAPARVVILRPADGPAAEPARQPAIAPPQAAPVETAPLPAAPVPWYGTLQTWLNLLVALWAVGAVVWFAWAGLHVWRFHRLLRHAREAPEEMQELARSLAAKMGLSRCPRVWLLPGPIPPLVWAAVGAVRVFLPERLLARLSPEQQASLLAHELAHVCRRDHWVRWLELVVLGLYWWYPLAWWVRRRLQAHEEECCDAWVVGELSPRAYASAILETVDFLSEDRPPVPLMASGLGRIHFLKRRLTLIMHARTPKRLGSFGRLAVVGLALLLLPVLPLLARTDPAPAETAKDGEKDPTKDQDRPAEDKADKPGEKKTDKPADDKKADPAEAKKDKPDAREKEKVDLEDRPLSYSSAAINLLGADNAIYALTMSPDGRLVASGGGSGDRPGHIKVWVFGTRREVASLTTPVGVISLAFAPDGRSLAWSGFDRRAHVVDLTTGDESYTLALDGFPHVAWSPDGKWLATASSRDVKLWDAATGKEVATLPSERQLYRQILFSPDGRRVIAVGGTTAIEEGAGRVAIWDVESRKPVANLQGHTRDILDVAISPDGATLATGSIDGTVILWDLAKKAKLATLEAHPAAVEALAFSRSGKLLASGGYDSAVRIWDVAKREEVRRYTDHAMPVRAVLFSPDDRRILTGSNDRAVRVFVNGGKETDPLLPAAETGGNLPAFHGLAAAPGGKKLALLTDERTVLILDAVSGDVLHTLKGHDDDVTCLAWSADGKTLATGSADRTVKVWDAETGKEKKTLTGHRRWVYAVAFSPDGKTLATAGYDKTVRLWDATTYKDKGTLTGHKGAIRALAFAPDSKALASGGADGTIRLWDLETLKERPTLTGHEGTVRALAFSTRGVVASAGEDGTVRLWDVAAGKSRRVLQGHRAEVTALAFSPRGRYLASGADDATVRVWDADSGDVVSLLRGHTEAVTGVAFGPGAAHVVSVSKDRAVKLWRAAPAAVRVLRAHTGTVRGLAVSSDGHYLLSSSGGAYGDGTLRLWDLRAGRVLRQFEGHEGKVLCVAFTPDGKRAVSGGDDKTLRVWEVPSGKQVFVLRGHESTVDAVTISRDGRLALSGAQDKTARLWDLREGKEVKKFAGHGDWVRAVQLTPDGKEALTAGFDKTIRYWSLSSGREVRRLTPGEAIETMTLSPDGTRAVTGGDNGQLRLWDVQAGRVLSATKADNFGVTSVVFSPDGRGYFSGGLDGSVRLYDARGGERMRFPSQREAVWRVAVTQDGKYVLSGGGGTRDGDRMTRGQDYGIRVWPVPAEMQPRQPLPRNGRAIDDLLKPPASPRQPGATQGGSGAYSGFKPGAGQATPARP